jgi:hypothetical protein
VDGTHRAATPAQLRPVRFERTPAPHLAWIYLAGVPGEQQPMVLVPVNAAGEQLHRFDVRLDNDRR